MVIERRWKKWVYFYIPLTVFVIGTLFPFYWMFVTAIRPDAELYRSWRAVTNTPFWTLAPTLDHFRDLLAKTTVPDVAVEHVLHRGGLHDDLALLWAPGRLRPGPAEVPDGRRSWAPRSSSRTWCRPRCCSSRWPTSSATSSSATRRGR